MKSTLFKYQKSDLISFGCNERLSFWIWRAQRWYCITDVTSQAGVKIRVILQKNTLLCHRSTTKQNDLTFIPKTPESTARFERGGWSICSSNVWSIYLYRRGSQCINTLQLESPLVCSALPSAQLSGQASAQFSAQCISQIAILSAAVTSFTNTSRPLGRAFAKHQWKNRKRAKMETNKVNSGL